ncbi:MAG: PAC2 family protein [Acidimicrobiia bacterium]|nr:PAC2 family protein [Acidimicrobiia bacterium]
MNLLRVDPDIEIDEPVLVIGLEGWIDAGEGAALACRTLLDRPALTVAEADADALFDHRARRPTLHIEEGVATSLEWPSLQIDSVGDDRARDVMVLHGAEPDHAWHAFIDEVVAFALDVGVTMVVGLGAYPAATPHTRPSRLSCTASTADLLDRYPFTRASIDVPAGIQAAIEHALHQQGVPAIGLWAQVPHYLTGITYPEAAAALLEGLDPVANRRVDVTDLREQAIGTRSRIDRLIADNDEHVEMLHQLETAYDAQLHVDDPPLPTGEDLAAEFQAFLRDQDE